MRPFVAVTGDFVETGGMDAANHALASHLARAGHEVHLVAHRVANDLAALPGVRLHLVPRPFASNHLGARLLDRRARRVMSELSARQPISIINGGNCRRGTTTWLHFVHAAHAPSAAGPLRRVWSGWRHRVYLAAERAAVARATAVIANSELTRRHAVELLGAGSAPS